MKPRALIVHGDVALVPLARGGYAIVDAADAALVERRSWHLDAYGYVVCGRSVRGKRSTPGLQTFLLDVPEGTTVDHIDGDPLNNRRKNLRYATPLQQVHNTRRRRDNTSGYKGVGLHKGRWRARIMVRCRRLHLGYFDSPEEAARAYDVAAREHFGEFARVNFARVEA